MRRSRIASPISRSKADSLFSLSIYYVVLYPGFRDRAPLANALAEFPEQSRESVRANCARSFSTRKQVRVARRSEISEAQATLLQKIESFILQVSDFLPVRILDKARSVPRSEENAELRLR